MTNLFFWAQNLISGSEIVRGVTTFVPDDLTITLATLMMTLARARR
jgi:hypothetical protein